MIENPYQAPAAESSNKELPRGSATGVRKGVGFAIAIIWNVPIVAVFYFLFTGAITERTMNLLIVCWAAMIPVFALLVAYTPIVQRLLFMPSFDITSKRSGLWALAGLWTVLSGIGLVSILVGG